MEANFLCEIVRPTAEVRCSNALEAIVYTWKKKKKDQEVKWLVSAKFADVTLKWLVQALANPLPKGVIDNTLAAYMSSLPCLKLLSRAFVALPRNQLHSNVNALKTFQRPLSTLLAPVKHSTAVRPFRIQPLVSFTLKNHFTQQVQNIEDKKDDVKVSVNSYNNWLDRLPPKLAPYIFLTRMDKPIGTWLLYWPCGKSVTASMLSLNIVSYI
jgi:hypothetical protein